MRALILSFLCALLLLGCSSEEPAPEPEIAATSAAPEPKAARKKTKRKRMRHRTKQKGKRRKKRPAQAVPEGHIYLNLRNADLKTQVLPLLENQKKVEIVWLGGPRTVNLPLKRTLPWEEAVDLVCRFSDTHLVRVYTGRYELRDGYKGQLESDGVVIAEGTSSNRGGVGSAKSRKTRKTRKTRSTRPAKRGKSRAKSAKRGAPSSGNDGWRQTHDAAKNRRSGNEAKDLLNRMGTRSTN